MKSSSHVEGGPQASAGAWQLDVTNQLEQIFAAANVRGFVHGYDVDADREYGFNADEPVVTASTFKVLVLVELFRQADKGILELKEAVTLPPQQRTVGPTGISVFSDAVTMSLRDLATSMIVVSDNTATDVLVQRLGLARINATAKTLGLTSTNLVTDCAGIGDSLVEDSGVATMMDLFPAPPASSFARLRSEDPLRTNSTTARDMTRLLHLIWTDTAASPAGCLQMRRALGQQVWPHRLASGFPEDHVQTAGKTGSVFSWRSEVGVVEYPDGGPYAIAVFTQLDGLCGKHPAADQAIGAAARAIVDGLRGQGA